MSLKIHHSVRVPVVFAAAAFGLLATVACGSDSDPAAGKQGGGLGAAKGGGGGGISVGKGGTTSFSVGGSTGTGGNGLGVGGGSNAGSAGNLNNGDACAVTQGQGDKQEVALLFMVDISGSMKCPTAMQDPPCTSDPGKTYDSTRWTVMQPALESFFASTDSSGLWAGISFFGRNNSCSASAYEMPDSEIALLPGAAQNLKTAIDKQAPNGYTPTYASMKGALTHADSWASSHANQQVVLVYATDGYPLGCNDPMNTIDDAANLAKAAYEGKNAIRTYVLGVGPNLTDLNKIASSGGTDQAMFIDTTKDFTADLAKRLDEIRSAVAIDCVYKVPSPPAGQNFDGRVNVDYTNGSGAVAHVGYNDAADCKEGWQYTDASAQEIKLCGTTCDTVKSDTKAKIDVLYGCTTVNVGDVR